MVLPDLMETEDNLIDYVKIKNIEGKVSIKKASKKDDLEEDKNENIEENLTPIEDNTEDEKLEFGNLDDVTSNLEPETPINNDSEGDKKTPESDEGTVNKRKGILKYQRTYSNKHVDFNMDLEFVPFDETKDYTIEIQIVEQMPKKIVSYAALFAQQKKDEEEKLKKEAEEREKQNRKHNKKRKNYEWKKILKQVKQNKTPMQDIEHNISQLPENNAVENKSATEDEMDDEKDDYSYHSDTDKEEHSDTVSTESESFLSVEDYTSANQDEPKSECKTSIDKLDEALDGTETGVEIKECYQNQLLGSESDISVENDSKDQSDELKFGSKTPIDDLYTPLDGTETGVEFKEVYQSELLGNESVISVENDSKDHSDEPKSECKRGMVNLNKPLNDTETGAEIKEVYQKESLESETIMSVEDNTKNQIDEPKSECKIPIDNVNKPLNDTEIGAEIKQAYQNELLESESFMPMEDNTSSIQSDEMEFDCKKLINELDKPLNDTETGVEIKELTKNKQFDNKCQNSRTVQGINESCVSSTIPENISDKSQLFCEPAKKQRSNSLSDLEDFKKIHRFVDHHLPREIELIVSRQLEKKYYE